MKRLLLVDDDAALTKGYRNRLSAHGFGVNTVGSGAGALMLLESVTPDLVVLDLVMTEVTGVDVLKFIRTQPRLAATPVVVLTNDPRHDLAQHAARIGIQKIFRKDQCSPSVLMAAIDEILEPRILATVTPPEPVADPEPCPDAVQVEALTSPDAPQDEAATLPNAPQDEAATLPNAPQAEAATLPDAAQAEAAATALRDGMAQNATEEIKAEARANFLADAPAICAGLGELTAALASEPLTGPEQQDHLQGLFLKVRFLVEMAGLTDLAVLGQAAAVFDALLYELLRNPERLGPSTLRTVESLVEVVGLLFQQAGESGGGTPLSARVLVVDDDPAANELVVAALGRAQLNAGSTEDSLAAWQWINSEHFDLVLLKMEMPVLNGSQLFERLRRMPGYEKIPVILVGAHDDLDPRAMSALIGTEDRVAKPILPQELAARVLMQLLSTQIEARLVPSGEDRTGNPLSTDLADSQFRTN